MAGEWKPLNTQPGFNAETMLLLTDGSVMVHEDASNKWHRWTPSVFDPMADYANGDWSQLAPMPDLPAGTLGGTTNAPRYFASAVLSDGRVFVAGGEYNGNVANANLLAAQIYDPIADAWTAITNFPWLWTQIGDAPCCVLADGRILLGNSNTAKQPGSNLTAAASTPAVFDPWARTWTPTPAKNDVSSEETWTLLPNGSVLTVQCSTPPGVERWNGANWVSDANTPVTLTQQPPGLGNEIGPAVLLPDGRVFAIGGNANTALYTPPPPPGFGVPQPPNGSWTAGPQLQDAQNRLLFGADTPACLLPNGRVLCCATSAILGTGSANSVFFFEFDPMRSLRRWMAANGKNPRAPLLPQLPAAGVKLSGLLPPFIAVPAPPNAGHSAFTGRMLLVPSGQVLFSNGTQDIQIYTPDPGHRPEWRPNLSAVPGTVVPGFTYRVAGTGFNGLSQAVSYGDDAAAATNYPVVRLAHLDSGHVRYARTSGHGMGVATGELETETFATIPWEMEDGAAQLTVIANGIPSNVVTVIVARVRSLRRWMTMNGKNPRAPLLPQLPAAGVELSGLLPA
jgi:hypothetical protein